MLYVFWGPDEFSIHEAVQRLLDQAFPDAGLAALNVTRLSGAEATIEALRFACEAVPFLAGRRAVVVEGLLTRLSSRRGGAGSAAGGSGAETSDTTGEPAAPPSRQVAELAAYLPSIPEATLAIFIEPAAPPKSGPLARALEQARARQQSFPLLSGPPLVRWIKTRARAAGAAITDEAAELLATFSGSDLRQIASELQKLATYAGPGRPIDAEAVRLLVSQASEANVFDLVDAIGQGNRPRALAALVTLLEAGERPERILGMVARQVRLLLQARDLLDHGAAPAAIAQVLGLPPYPLRKVLEQARLFDLPALVRMHRRVLETDVQIKTGVLEPALVLDVLVATLAGVAGPAAPPAARRRSPAAG